VHGSVHGRRRAVRARREARIAVVARIDEGRVLLDLRTVDPADDGRLAELIVRAASTLFP